MENWMSSSVLLGEYLYGFDEIILKCIEAKYRRAKMGAPRVRQRHVAPLRRSPNYSW